MTTSKRRGLKASAALAVSALTLGVTSGAAHAQTQDGLVNVNVGDVTILEDVQVGVAANVIAQVCGVNVNAVVGLLATIERVDATDRSQTLCRADDGQVRVTQNQ